MTRLWVGLLLVTLAGLEIPSRAVAGEVVSWLTADTPPSNIWEGELANQGFNDQQLRLLFKAAPEFEHRTLRADAARVFYELTHNNATCFNGVFRSPQREEILVFGNRPRLMPGYRFLIQERRKKEFEAFMNPAGEVDLALLENHGKMVGGILKSRNYLDEINKFLADFNRKTRFEILTEEVPLFQMVENSKVDFAFVQGWEISYFAGKTDNRRRLIGLPIKNVPRLSEVFPACSKGPVGEAVIRTLDRWMEDEANWAAYIAPLKHWIDPADYAAALAAKPRKPGP